MTVKPDGAMALCYISPFLTIEHAWHFLNESVYVLKYFLRYSIVIYLTDYNRFTSFSDRHGVTECVTDAVSIEIIDSRRSEGS
jgi:hypothetical protein